MICIICIHIPIIYYNFPDFLLELIIWSSKYCHDKIRYEENEKYKKLEIIWFIPKRAICFWYIFCFPNCFYIIVLIIITCLLICNMLICEILIFKANEYCHIALSPECWCEEYIGEKRVNLCYHKIIKILSSPHIHIFFI